MAAIIAGAGLATSDGIGGRGPGARKAGTRAALMLADLDDPRAIPPLARVFSTGGFLQSKYQSQIETTLARFLASVEGRPGIARCAPDILALAKHIWHSDERHDLSPAFADILLSALHCLQQVDGPENTDLLRAIAKSVTVNEAKQPERARVREAAAKLLSPIE